MEINNQAFASTTIHFVRALWLSNRRLALLGALNLIVTASQAGGSSFQDEMNIYKSAIKPVDSAPFNSDFIANLAVSQAMVMVSKGVTAPSSGDTGASGTGIISILNENSVGKSGLGSSGGGLNLASPIITGTVNGNVTVIVQPGAIKGNITSIAPR